MKQFIIKYNDGKGEMTLNLENFFKRKDNGKFENTTKPDIYKIFKLVNEWCDDEQKLDLLRWLNDNKCSDLVSYYEKKYNFDFPDNIPLF